MKQSSASTDVGDAEFFEMSLDCLCVAGFDGYWKRLNPSWRRTLGWTAEEMMSRPLIEFCHPDDHAGIHAARERLFAGLPVPPQLNRYRCRDGSYRWFEWRSTSNVERQLVYAVARDITDARAAQREHQELTEALEATLNGIAEGVIATQADGTIARMNPVGERLTGWTSTEAAGQSLDEVVRMSQSASGPVLVARDGRELAISFSRAPIHGPDGAVTGAVLVLRDVTAEKQAREAQQRLERQLVFADRMASLGTMAAGVAHEINNPLAYAMANIDMMIEELGTADPVALVARAPECVRMAREAREGAERIRKIVRGLMTFSRADEERRAVIDVRPVIELAINMTFNEIRHRARLVKDYGPIPQVDADESRLGQVLMNLLVNAAQAVPEGDSDRNEIRVVTSTDETGNAVIEVRDTGPGIPEAIMKRIFDPFFTTKPIGIGTGLGLSICHGIVTSLGGQITASNGAGGGATFRVVLPAATAGAQAATGRRASPAPRAHRATVLVVDDERAVGVSLGRVLRDHDVTPVTSAKAALELVLSGKTFDVILSDLMLPGMSGMELYDELARRRPEAAERMVFMTGGAFTPAARAFLDRVPNERIDKPFTPAAVRALVAKFVS